MDTKTPDKWAPNAVLILQRGIIPVTQTVAYPPGNHPTGCPIKGSLVAVELRTDCGSRWYGFERAWIDSHLRMRCSGWNQRNELVASWDTATD